MDGTESNAELSRRLDRSPDFSKMGFDRRTWEVKELADDYKLAIEGIHGKLHDE